VNDEEPVSFLQRDLERRRGRRARSGVRQEWACAQLGLHPHPSRGAQSQLHVAEPHRDAGHLGRQAADRHVEASVGRAGDERDLGRDPGMTVRAEDRDAHAHAFPGEGPDVVDVAGDGQLEPVCHRRDRQGTGFAPWGAEVLQQREAPTERDRTRLRVETGRKMERDTRDAGGGLGERERRHQAGMAAGLRGGGRDREGRDAGRGNRGRGSSGCDQDRGCEGLESHDDIQ
jgi:hypothetical protein